MTGLHQDTSMNIRTIYDRWLRITYWPHKRKHLKRMLAVTTQQARDRGIAHGVALEVCEHYGYTKDWCKELGWTVTRVTDDGVAISASNPCVVTAAHKLRAYQELACLCKKLGKSRFKGRTIKIYLHSRKKP